MPLWLSASLGALIRYILFGVGTFMVSKGYWDQTVADTFVDGALAQILSWVLMIGPIVWMFIVKNADKITLFNALLSPQVLTEDTAKAMPTPAPAQIAKVEGAGASSLPTKVSAVLLALGLSASLTACASGGAMHIQVASYGARITDVAVQAQNIVLTADKSGLLKDKTITGRAMVAFRELGEVTLKLADGLRLYDALTPAQQIEQTPQIEKLLNEARRLSRVALVFAGSVEVGEQLARLFDNLDAFYLEIQRGLRQLKS